MDHPWDRRLGVWWIAEDQPEAPAIVESPSGVALTFGELTGRAHQLVHALRNRGLIEGDIVAYALPNDVDVVWWQLALQEGGFQSIALNPALSATEIRGIVDHSGAAAIVVDAHYGDRVNRAGEAESITVRVSVGGDIASFMTYEALVARQPTTLPVYRALGIPITYSSGTTGKPKAIARPGAMGDPSVLADKAKLFGRAFQFQPFDGVHLVSAGMHHGGCQGFYLGALNVGQPLAIMGKFEPEKALRMIEEHAVTTAYMVPTQFVRLLRLSSQLRSSYDVSSLRVVVHSAAPCPVEVKTQMMEWWGPVIWETYGGMEGAATIAKPQQWIEKPGTVGRARRGMKVKILDDAGQLLKPREVGNVFLESTEPTFIYRNDPELTDSVHKGRAFTLGDVGYLDDDGFLFLRDRAKDMVISGGVNIYPAEVEATLISHPMVGDVAVIGVPDEEWGESVKAIVELVENVDPSDELADELIGFCAERMAKYKCPRTIDFRSSLPRTDGGKLLKRLLRDEYWAESGRSL